jgi:hypothetical protein
MFARRKAFLVAVLLAAGTACADDTTAPIDVRATVVVPETLSTRQTPTATVQWIDVSMPVSIHNTSSVPLSFFYCGSAIEAESGGSWKSVWSPVCALSQETSSPILPGETRVVEFSVNATISVNDGPMWGDGTLSGRYRLSAALLPDGYSGTIPRIASNTFTLVPSPMR